jgi:hypothetical protein
MPSYHTRLFLCLAGEGFSSFPRQGNGGTLSCAPSAVADAGNGAPLNWRPSADAVAGNGRDGRGSQDLRRYRLCLDA